MTTLLDSGVRDGVCTGPGPCVTSPLGEGKNWVTKVGGLPLYIRAIAASLIRAGHSESDAISLAVGTVKRWAAGGGKVTPATRARAAKAVAEWEAKRGAAHGTRDIVTESSSAGALIPRFVQSRPPVPREAKLIGPVPHAFRGVDTASCSRCHLPATNPIHRRHTSGKRALTPVRSLRRLRSVAAVRTRNAEKAAFNADADAIEPKFAAAMSGLFDQQSRATLSRLRGKRGKQLVLRNERARVARRLGVRSDQIPSLPPAGTPPGSVPPAPPPPPDASQIFDAAFWAGKTADLAIPFYEAMTEAGRVRVNRQIGLGDATTSISSAPNILTSRANRMAHDVTQTTYDAIQKQLAEGQSAGESIPQLAERVKGVFQEATQNRAMMIARTETIGALNEAALAHAQTLSPNVVSRKEWLAKHDSRECPVCAELDGKTVDLASPFPTVAFGPVLTPPAHIQCRCSILFLPPAAA